MARKHNFLLGNGEKLTAPVAVPSGGGAKNPPYSLLEAKERFKSRIKAANSEIIDLPSGACPGGEVVLSLTMHPRYVSKSDFPNSLLTSLGLRSVGSRAKKVTPDKWGVKKHPAEAITDEIFVAGDRRQVAIIEAHLDALTEQSGAASDLLHIEDVSYPAASRKLKRSTEIKLGERGWLEVVLHNQTKVDVLEAFTEFASQIGAEVDISRHQDVGGLTFVPVAATAETAIGLSQFSFLRVARSMPTLRPLRPSPLRISLGPSVELPSQGPVSTNSRALIFDGGIPSRVRADLAPWVTLIEPDGIGPASNMLEEHGLAVTSAFLFGSIEDPKNLRQPICHVDHVRVADAAALTNGDPYYFDVLDRIVTFLDTRGREYSLINISMGPRVPTDDDDVTLWTAKLDKRFSSGEWVVTVAAGNDGDRDTSSGLNRIQPPSDGVNILSVGACDSFSQKWSRAEYSCIGPGRNPGLVKPDGLAFGGSDAEPFFVISSSLRCLDEQGTSLASPYALRSAAAIKAQLGDSLRPLTIRSLLIHRTEASDGLATSEIGWGRFESDSEKLITCDDHEALVIYQGELPIGEHLRASIPLPLENLNGMIELAATLLISTEVDPEHPSAYTRNGLTVSFRPHSEKFSQYDDGAVSLHPKTVSFFSAKNMYSASEFGLREDGLKWEPCLRGQKNLRHTSLKNPCFDIYNHRREDGGATIVESKINYALVVTVRARGVLDLYDRILRSYSNILIPLRPQVRIEVGV